MMRCTQVSPPYLARLTRPDHATGSGAQCGSYCTVDYGDNSNQGDDILQSEFDGATNLILLTVVPVSCILLLMTMFYGANYSVDRKFEADPALIGYAEPMEDDNYRLSARFSHARRMYCPPSLCLSAPYLTQV
jgi:hypothetical protein